MEKRREVQTQQPDGRSIHLSEEHTVRRGVEQPTKPRFDICLGDRAVEFYQK